MMLENLKDKAEYTKGVTKMLQLRKISKQYKTENLVQTALDKVSLNLRDNEFVAILGPSGSGKTTLLNIIGGLDRYDSGDLIINNVSTKKYSDRDWDSYRNHTIGFVFQSYNLIPHQTILSNVELALTISGVSKSERRKRATEALEKVGLGKHLHKKPNQLSGGQMQRVAIARALINNPDILLADEPTGALDSETSIQVMELLKEVAKDKLVVMVTHNPELAEEYATRIVRLQDGKIISDSSPYKIDKMALPPAEHKNMGKSSMSFLTSLALSFNNLRTKKARTFMTAFAGSIGIIGIALILAISNGVNDYIGQIEEDTLSEYPVQIESTGFDFTSLLTNGTGSAGEESESGDISVTEMITTMLSKMNSNDLKALREYFESGESDIWDYAKAIEYVYDIDPQIYLMDEDENVHQVNPNSSLNSYGTSFSTASYLSSMMSVVTGMNLFYEMPESDSLYKDQYDVKAGHWPENYDECVLVLNSDGSISDLMLYTLGLRDYQEYSDMLEQYSNGEDVETTEITETYDYEDVLGITFKLVNSTAYYEYDSEYELWVDKTDDDEYLKKVVEAGEDITIVGIVQPSENASSQALTSGINYTSALITHIAEVSAESEIVKEQLENPDVDVFTGEKFGEESSDFDLSSLFTIDTDALNEAFDISGMEDTSFGSVDFSDLFNLDGSSMDLSGMIDSDSISIDSDSLSGIDMSSILSGITINASTDEVNDLATSLMEGYQTYAANNDAADYNDLANDFSTYLSSSQAQSLISDFMTETLENSDAISISTDSIDDLLSDVLEDYESYVSEQTDPESVTTDAYLATGRAQDIFDKWADENVKINGDYTISTDSLNQLSADLASGYVTYASENGLTDISSVSSSLAAYLSTDDASEIITNSITGMIDTSGLEQQLTEAVTNSMQSVTTSYSEAIEAAIEEQVESMISQISEQITVGMETAMTQMMTEMTGSLENILNIDEETFASAFDFNMDSDALTEILSSLTSSASASYDGNLEKMGYVDFDSPSEIDIYPYDFESKDGVIEILDNYNARMEDEGNDDKVITYTDTVGTLMSSVTTIIDVISYVLIAFVSVSLIVSSIMIGIITYVSVLERTREIGILRAIGASKKNISRIFNAETLIIGLCAGLIGIGISLLLIIPINSLIHAYAGTTDVNAVLPAANAIVLIILSMVLTLIGGLLPSRAAAKKDPVTALRTE